MLERIGLRFEYFVRQYMPDPFLLVLLLTLLTFAMAKLFTQSSFDDLVQHWFYGTKNGDGFWDLLSFAMQMVLIVVTGEAVASSPIVHNAIKSIAGWPKSDFSAVAFVSFASILFGWLHWGFGLISAALLAREVAAQAKARGIKIHYPLLGAAGYTSLLIWHGGLSASAPLIVNTPGHFLEKDIGLISLEKTIFHPMNFVACGLLLFTVPFLLAAMTPKKDQREISPETLSEMKPVEVQIDRSTIAGKIDASPITSWIIGGLGVYFLVKYFRANGANLNHNIVNFSFLMAGMLLHRSPVAYMKAISQSVRGVGGIVLQFPFYGGIMGIMKGSGLGHLIAHQFVYFASAGTLPFFTYLSSIFTKLFIPSGAGEWAVEGPIMLAAAKDLGASYGKTIMAVAYGNMVGNMFQPFWALPLLGIMGLTAREIMGYCLVVFCFAFPLLGVILLLFA
ncbi:MAG TPA: TIGR00366 family protein [Planctomycetota bacterium]|nr:TIGR00366 family protein [Planctomycetota bacterium]